MLYRIHRQRPNGKSLGYIQLCTGYVHINSIREDLVRKQIISDHWFAPNELKAVAEPSNVYGVYAYSVVRSKPAGKNPYLFFLDPLTPRPEIQELSNQPWKISDWNKCVQYGIPNTYVFQPFTGTQITNNTIQQAPQQVLQQARYYLDEYIAQSNGIANQPPIGQQITQGQENHLDQWAAANPPTIRQQAMEIERAVYEDPTRNTQYVEAFRQEYERLTRRDNNNR